MISFLFLVSPSHFYLCVLSVVPTYMPPIVYMFFLFLFCFLLCFFCPFVFSFVCISFSIYLCFMDSLVFASNITYEFV